MFFSNVSKTKKASLDKITLNIKPKIFNLSIYKLDKTYIDLLNLGRKSSLTPKEQSRRIL